MKVNPSLEPGEDRRGTGDAETPEERNERKQERGAGKNPIGIEVEPEGERDRDQVEGRPDRDIDQVEDDRPELNCAGRGWS